MKQLLALLFLIPLSAFSQSKTWTGTSTRMWPNLAPSAFIIDKNGTNTITVNNINAITSDTVLARFQQFGTNLFSFIPPGAGFGDFSALVIGDNTAVSTNVSNLSIGVRNGASGSGSMTFTSFSGDDNFTTFEGGVELKTVGSGQASLALTSTVDSYTSYYTALLRASGSLTLKFDNNGTVLTLIDPTESATSVPYLLGTDATHTSANLLEVQNNATNKFNVTFDGKIQTAGPVTTAGQWQLGLLKTNSAVTIIADSYVEISIGGQVLKLAIVQ